MKWSCKLTYLVLANTSYADSNLPLGQLSSQKGILRARWRNPGDTRCRRIHYTRTTRGLFWRWYALALLLSCLQSGSKFTVANNLDFGSGCKTFMNPADHDSFLMLLTFGVASFGSYVPSWGLTWTMQNNEKKPWGIEWMIWGAGLHNIRYQSTFQLEIDGRNFKDRNVCANEGLGTN